MKIVEKYYSTLLLIIAFFEGASLMATEIVSSKIISPFYGNSLYVWTSVFTVTIGSLTLGYFFGGIISKKYNPHKSLIAIFSCSLLLLLLLKPLSEFVFSIFFDFSLKSGVLLVAFFIIFPLVFCFGLVSPIIIRALSLKLNFVGKNSGLVYTISTLGGIIMTFLVGLYLIPYVGVTGTIIIIAVLIFTALVLSIALKSIRQAEIQPEDSPAGEKNKSTEAEAGNNKKNPKILYLLAFLEGAMVIAIEIIGSKMIQPVLGNSLIVWTIVIGITITFLTIGYYVGGNLSRGKNSVTWIASGLGIGALFFLLMPIVSLTLFESYIDKSVILNGIVITSILIGPALFFLGLTSPLIIQLLTLNLADSGKNAGFVYAISSLGGIVMTLSLGMYIMEEWGIVKPIFVLSSLLILVSLIFLRSVRQIVISLIFVFLSIIVYSKYNEISWSSKNIKFHYVSESLMGQLKVYDEYFPIEELEYRLLLINGICQTIIVNNREVVSTWKYVHSISRLASTKRNKTALLLGMGGGSIATELNKLNIKADLVDIDGRMFEISKKYFYYNDSISTFYLDDARHYVNTCKKKYDLIILDVASGENQPSNLFTKEGFKQVFSCLTEDGIVILNFQELRNNKPISAHESICNTVLSLGMKIQYQKSAGACPDIINLISKKDLDVNHIPINQLSSSYPYLGIVQELIQQPYVKVERPFKSGIILEDDKPMLDILNAKTIRFWRQDANRVYAQKHLKMNNPIFH